MDENKNNTELQNALNNVENESIENQMPALNNDNAKENIVANDANVDMNNVKSVFEDMNISTQTVENDVKIDSLDNSPIAPAPQEEQQVATQQVEVPQENAYNLNATTIGTIKPDKQKSPIAMIVLFGALFLFMIFMPEVLNYVNNKFGTNFNSHSGERIEEIYEDNQDESQKITMYDFNDKTEIALDKISIQSFSKIIENEEYKLSFTIKNSGTQLYEFKKKLFFEFYDANKTFVGRAYLENISQITGGVTNSYKITINKDIYDNAQKIELVQRTNDDYNQIQLVGNQLTCTNNKYNLVYTFDENQRLTYIKDMYTYTKTDDVVAYTSDLISYKSKINNLDNMDGVTAVLTETDTGFITTIAIDYSQADYSRLSSDTNYYKKDTYARVISFEMNAKGYNCR